MKKQARNDGFLTHIAEPRWQQIVSVLMVLGLAGLWVWAALIRHRN